MNTHRIALLLLFAGFLLGGPVHAIDPPHDPDCATCHGTHGNNYPGLLGKLCKGCHFEGGPATSVRRHSSLTTDDGYGNWDVDCWTCHDPHEHEQNWVYGTSYGKYLRAELRAVVKEVDPADPGPYYDSLSTLRIINSPNVRLTDSTEYVDGDTSTDDDMCQVCHVNTLHYNSDGASNYHHDVGADSQPGGNCMSCHTHTGGFAAGSCRGCHATAQGAGGERRQVTGTGGDFERPSHHVSDGSTTEIVLDSDCVVCHDQASHMAIAEPGVILNDPDGGLATVYDGTGASTEDWCLTCHDADSSTSYDADGFAGNGQQPFSDGKTPPDVAQDWALPSEHAVTPNSDMAVNGCMSCHGGGDSTQALEGNAHGSVQAALHSDYVEGEAVANDEESLCFACHDSDPDGASTDIESRFDTSGTGYTIYHHPIDDTEQEPGREVECTSCHNHHAATDVNPIRNVLGTDIEGDPVGPGTANPRQALEYELCLNCHGDTYNDTMYRTTNKRLDIYPANSAFHPVAAAGQNQSTAMQNQLVGGMTTSSIIKCIDCHNNEATADVLGSADNSPSGPKGTHGSNIGWNLRAAYLEEPDPGSIGWSADNFRLCFLCHAEVAFTSYVLATPADTNFNYKKQNQQRNLHWIHMRDTANRGVTCANCHYNNHGSQDAFHTNYIVNGTLYTNPPPGFKTRLVSFSPEVTGAQTQDHPILEITTSTRSRKCTVACHGFTHTGRPYTPLSSGDDDGLTY